MRRSIQVGLGLALTGGLLTVGCGDRWSWTHVPIDEGPGSPGPGSHPDAGGGPCNPPPPQLDAPRLVAPLSGSLTATNRPVFRWQSAAGADGVVIDICADRACQNVVQQIDASVATASASRPLPAGPVFWRARSTVQGAPGGPTSPTWELFVPHRDGDPSGALATRFDYDGDGFGDFALDDRVVLGGPDGYRRSFPLVGPTPPADATFFAPAGDLNGDGFADVIRLDASTAQSPMGIFSPTPLYGGPQGFTAGVAMTAAQPLGAMYHSGPAGDVNGDGYADFLFKTRFDALTYLGGAAAITDGPAPAASGSQSFYAFGADYDGDGYADAASVTNGVPELMVTRGTAAGFDGAGATTLTPSVRPTIGALATVDGNGDAFADLAVGVTGGALQIFAGSAGGLAATPAQTLQVTPACSGCAFIAPIATGDFNGDGAPDLVTQETSGGTNPTVYAVHFGGPTGFDATGTPLALPAEARLSEQSITDVNRDGFEDLTAGLADTITNPDGSLRFRTTRFTLLLGGPSGLAPSSM